MAASRTPLPPPSPRESHGFGYVLWALFSYHVLLLAGAGVFLISFARSSEPGLVTGAALILAGIVAQQVVIGWAARQASRGAPFALDGPGVPPRSRFSDPGGRWLCPACGWKGARGGGSCPRCGRFLVRLPPASAPAGATAARRVGP